MKKVLVDCCVVEVAVAVAVVEAVDAVVLVAVLAWWKAIAPLNEANEARESTTSDFLNRRVNANAFSFGMRGGWSKAVS